MRALHGTWIVAAAAVLLLSPLGSGPVPHASSSAATNVLAVYQTPDNITEQSNFTVHLQVADSTNVQQVWFTFCQLSSSLCYLPIVMSPGSGNWYAGTSHPMTSYPGMTVGIRAGYNITIVYNDNTTESAPNKQNPVGTLPTAQTITGTWEFEMVVADHVYGLSGTVTSLDTHTAVSGATVTLTPGTSRNTTTDATGGYAFAGVLNGTYTVSVTGSGYLTRNVTVVIAGQNSVSDVSLSTHAVPDQGGASGFFTSPVGLGAIALLAILVLVVLVAFLRSRKKKEA